jgi:hypothetical protein
MSIYEHTDIKQQIFDFQKLYLRYLNLKLRMPFDVQDPTHHVLAQTILDRAQEAHHPGVGPADRRMFNTVEVREDGMIGINEATSTSVGLLAIDLLVSTMLVTRESWADLVSVSDIGRDASSRFCQSGSPIRVSKTKLHSDPYAPQVIEALEDIEEEYRIPLVVAR